LRAKKSYGQHFLTSEEIAEQIADGLILEGAYKKVLEIGPGKGMLTKYLLEKDFDLLVVEADRDMVMHLQKHFPKLKDYIISADVLKVDLNLFFKDEPFAIIGNFPYNISSQILFKMLEYKSQVPELVGMFQKEVAERVVSKPGSKVYGVISVLIQAFYDGELILDVDKSYFQPPPKVQSAVIRLTRKDNQDLGCDEKLFRQVVKQAFSQRRKMLRNTMKSYLNGDSKLENDFFKQRPEELSLENFVSLTNWIEERNSLND
jgi:16S rRNA (adenine1518-N6/adenine1519-N6)-dimethyltransferase